MPWCSASESDPELQAGEAGGSSSSRAGVPKRGIFFDFDSTLTTPIKLSRFQRVAIADRPEIFSPMTSEGLISNFGGRSRLQQLSDLFQSLQEVGCELYIVSIGLRDACIIPHLKALGLVK